MTIQPQGTSAVQGPTSGTASAITGNGEVTQLFTTLLVAQIRNQNPLEPADPSEFVSQLSQLSQVESLQQLAKQTSANGAMLESLQVLALGNHIGTRVTAATDHVVVAKEPITGHFTLESGSESVTLVLENGAGQAQRIALGTRPAGDVPFTIDPVKLDLAPGTYSLRVETAGASASPVVQVVGTLRGVRITPAEGVRLDMEHVGEIASDALTAFNGAPAQDH
ncbi:MAG: flagellar basal body rod modification protein [Steroidobacteraceae bacterium]|nr:flagellar basal body rod modification protein [Steroidobacteraceae bacterium]